MNMMLDMTRLTHNSYEDLLNLPFYMLKNQYKLLKEAIQRENKEREKT